MSDWDGSGDEKPKTAAVATRSARWKEEEAEEEAKSDWEQSSDSDGQKKTPAQGTAPPPKKKGSLKAKLADKEAERKRKLENGEFEEEYLDMREKFMDEKEMRRIMREKELEADLNNASDLFGTASLAPSSSSKTTAAKTSTSKPAPAPQLPPHLAPFLSLPAKLNSKADFDTLSRLIYTNLIKPHAASGQYAAFVEAHAKELCTTLNEGQTRKVANAVSGLAATKLAASKNTGKKKPAVGGKGVLAGEGGGKGKYDTTAYDEALDDFGEDPDDFM